MKKITYEIWGKYSGYIDDFTTLPKAKKHMITIKEFDENLIKEFEFATEVIAGIRTIRKDKNISFKETIDLKVINNEKASTYFDTIISKYIELKSSNVQSIKSSLIANSSNDCASA